MFNCVYLVNDTRQRSTSSAIPNPKKSIAVYGSSPNGNNNNNNNTIANTGGSINNVGRSSLKSTIYRKLSAVDAKK